MKLLIVEDEPLYGQQLEMIVDRLGYSWAGVYDNAFDALDAFHRENPDLLLLDIHLAGEMDGISFAERVNRIRPVPTVFITSLQDDETFARAQLISPVAYIIKPFDDLQLQRTIELAVAKLAGNTATHNFEKDELVLSDCLFVKVRHKLEKVLYENILYLEADNRYCILYTVDHHKYAVRMPLNEFELRLPSDRFARIHRSFIINLKWLQSIDLQDMLVIMKDKQLPLSKGHREEVLARLEQV